MLFAPVIGKEAGDPLDDPKKQHRLRRTVCKGWRNKQWHGRMLAFLELLSGEEPYISLALGTTAHIRLEPSPMLFSSPVSTFLPDQLSDEQEEQDDSTLEHLSIRLGVARVCEISFAFFLGNPFEKRGDCSPKLLNSARLHFA